MLDAGLTGHPVCYARGTEATNVLQSCATHGEIADEVPDQGGDLEDGGDEGEEEGLELERMRVSPVLLARRLNTKIQGIMRKGNARHSETWWLG